MSKQVSIRPKDWNSASNSFRYQLGTTQTFEGYEISLYSLSLYNSFFNISSNLGNNSISLTFNADFVNYTNNYDQQTALTASSYTFNVNIPDGFYDTETMNYFILNELKKRKLYCTLEDQDVYFIQLITNSTVYGNQLNMDIISNTASYTYVDGCNWTFSSSPKTMAITFNDAFGILYGFTGATYGNSSSNLELVSDLTPQVNQVDNISVCCNLIDNSFAQNNSNELTCIPFNVKYGALITYTDNYGLYSSISKNRYSYIDISFRDQNGNLIKIKDTQAVISLSFKPISK